MKQAAFYLSYSLRSLARGGQRTLLAIFCISIGVAAIVGLELVTSMVQRAITSNARAVNQGDINIGLQSAPLQDSDLAFFDSLRSRQLIRQYTAEASSGGVVQTASARRVVSVRAVDPLNFPLVGTNKVEHAAGPTLIQALSQTGSAVATSQLATELGLQPGASFRVLLTNGSVAQLRLAGIARAEDASWTGNSVTVSIATWEAVTAAPATYQTVAITTSSEADTNAIAAMVRRQFPLASVRTSDDVLRQAERGIETTRKFLVVIGLIALLIGGVGIVNTMQVLLARRRVEIAVLKTSGYQRRDLYALFGLEAVFLGLAGGASGSLLGIAVAAGLRKLFTQAFPLVLPFAVDGGTVIGGAAIGLATSLIFGLLPIIRAAAVRPQAVLRDVPEWQETSSWLQSAVLVAVLLALFCALASVILKSVLWAAIAVYGGFAVLGLLSVALGGILWILGRLPVPDRFTVPYLLIVSAGVAAAAALLWVQPLRGVGVLALAFMLTGYAIVLFPRGWKVNAKLALRNIGRSRGRSTTTLLALFIGVFAVGVVLVLGQDLRASLGGAVASQLDYNVVAVVPVGSGSEVASQLPTLPGVQGSRVSNFATASAVAVNGQPSSARNTRGGNFATSRLRRQLRLLGGVQGYDVQQGQLPRYVQITAGRGLNASDAGSSNALVEDSLREPPLRLAVGDTVTLQRPGADTTETLTIAGFYNLNVSGGAANFNVAPIFSSQQAALQLAGSAPFEIYYVLVSPQDVAQSTSRLQDLAPDAIVLNLDDFLSQFEQILGNILVMLTAVASLALISGVIIVANAVALAMLERRRELGILKAVGYTSGQVLSGVLLENTLTAGLGGLLGMAPVSLVVLLFNRKAGVHFGVPAPLTIAVVVGVVGLTSLTTALVAWRAVRVRPLTILRYE